MQFDFTMSEWTYYFKFKQIVGTVEKRIQRVQTEMKDNLHYLGVDGFSRLAYKQRGWNMYRGKHDVNVLIFQIKQWGI